MKNIISEKLKEPVQQLKKEEITVRLVVLTFLGGIFHAIVTFTLYWIGIVQAVNSGNTAALLTVPWYHTLIYLVSLFTYCLVISTVFKEKRVVSPLLVQTVAAGTTFAITLTALFMLSNVFPFETILGQLVAQLLFIFYVFFAYAFVITRVLRRLTGYNGSRDDLHELTFKIEQPYKMILSLLTDKTFIETNDLEQFEIEETDEEIAIIKSQRYTNPRVTIAFAPHPDEPNKTVISLCSYELKYNSIMKSPSAFQELKNKKGAIMESIRSAFHGEEEKEETNVTRPADVASWEALRITRSTISSLQKPRYSILAIIGISIAIGTVMTFIVTQGAQPDNNSIITIWTSILAIITSAAISLALEGKSTKTKAKKVA